MLTTIEKATQNFCIHQIRLEHTINDSVSQKRTVIAYIDIETQDVKHYRVYIAADLSFMQRVAMLFLEEEESDEETLIDMALELTNLIVGSAKVLAADENKNPYTIKTPYFEKTGYIDFAYDEAKTIIVENDEITIAIKETDADFNKTV